MLGLIRCPLEAAVSAGAGTEIYLPLNVCARIEAFGCLLSTFSGPALCLRLGTCRASGCSGPRVEKVNQIMGWRVCSQVTHKLGDLRGEHSPVPLEEAETSPGSALHTELWVSRQEPVKGVLAIGFQGWLSRFPPIGRLNTTEMCLSLIRRPEVQSPHITWVHSFWKL